MARLIGLDEALRRRDEFRSLLQPICDLRGGGTVGWEALLRLPAEAAFAGPLNAFRVAAAAGRLPDLEIAALEAHLAAARELPPGRLFLNLSALSFDDERLAPAALTALVKRAGLVPRRVVLELTELVQLGDPVAFARRLRPLRDEGFSLAVDDFGVGSSNVPLLVELAPDFVKLDASLVTGARGHLRKRVVLEALAQLGRRLDCHVVAEGLETEADVETAAACGIPLGQGWALGRPAPVRQAGAPDRPLRPVPAVVRLVSRDETVAPLAAAVVTVGPRTPVGQLVPLFERDEQLVAVPVVDGRVAVGLVTRERLFFHLGHQFGFSLWRDRPVLRLLAEIGARPETIRADASLEEGAAAVASRPAARRYDPLVVEGPGGTYAGIVTVDALLREITRLKVGHALQASPLTGLPGTAVLTRRVEARLAAGQPFVLGWADLDSFKPFNDRYGFARGDAALLLTAEVLGRRLIAGPDELLCHAGGDDFAFVLDPGWAEERAREAAAELSARVTDLYDPADRGAGGIVAVDRHGVPRRFGFLSLSIGLVAWSGEEGQDYESLVTVAAEVKRAAKAVEGPSVVLNRRRLELSPKR